MFGLSTVLGAATPFELTPAMFDPLIEGITTNISVIVPIGLGIMATMIGISFIPKLIRKFIK